MKKARRKFCWIIIKGDSGGTVGGIEKKSNCSAAPQIRVSTVGRSADKEACEECCAHEPADGSSLATKQM